MADRDHVLNALKPEGEKGIELINVMNSGNHEKMSLWALDQLDFEFPYGSRILDIGCGGGANLARFLIKYPQAHVTGVDYSETCVEQSKLMVSFGIKDKRCVVEQGDVSKLPFEDETFKLVSAFETIYFWPSIKDNFKEVLRVLKPGAAFMICNETDGREKDLSSMDNVSDLMHIYSEEELKSLLFETGFSKVTTSYNPDTNWILVLAYKA